MTGRATGILAALGLILLPAWQPPSAGEDPAADVPPALRFAEHLYSERDFYRAITEYKRFLFEHPDSGRAGWVRLRIGQSYLAGRKYEAARALFAGLRDSAPDGELRGAAALARSFYLDGRLQQSLGVLEDLLPASSDASFHGAAWYLAGCAHLRAGSLDSARAAFGLIRANHDLAERAGLLLARIHEGEDLPEKSPALAGLLSIVPGMGHFYLEEYSTGLTALAWNGMFGYATYEAFRHRKWGVGVLLAALELLWYSGTIYGAVSGAERHNRDAVFNYIDTLDRLAGLDVDFPDDKWIMGVLLKGRF